VSPRTFHSEPAPGCIRTRRRGVAVDRIIIHTMEGSFDGTIRWFQTPKRKVLTCAHYLISRRGDICQMVGDAFKAIHAGSPTELGWNDRSIGIEHEDWAHDAEPPPDAMLRASAKVVRILCLKFDIPMDRTHIIGHVEVPGATHTDPGPLWPWDAYMRYVREEA